MNRCKTLTRDIAFKLDIKDETPFYADEEDDTWYVFGINSGFAYASYATHDDANEEAEAMNK